MGYTTYYSVSIENANSDEQEKTIIDELIGHENREARCALSEMGTSDWKGRDDEMKELSRKYPELIFAVRYDGDEYDDMGYFYYHKGMMQHCPAIITYEKYCYEKLS